MAKKFQKIFFSTLLAVGLLLVVWGADAGYNPYPYNKCHWELTLVKVEYVGIITLEEKIQFIGERLREWDYWEIIDHSPTWDWVVVKYRDCKPSYEGYYRLDTLPDLNVDDYRPLDDAIKD